MEPAQSVSAAQPGPAIVPLVTAITALGSISVSVYLPSLPAIAKSLQATPALTKLTLTAFLFTFALVQLAYGPVSDRYGRKPPILWGISIYLAGSLACAFAPDVGTLIGARMIQALGAGAGPALGRAVIRDLFSGPRLTSALAIVAAAVALSPMLGPFAGGYIATLFGWRATFVMLAAVGATLGVGLLLLLPETSQKRDPASTGLATILRRYKKLLTDKEYAAAVLCGGFLTAGNFAWNAAAPFVLADRYRIGPDRYGTLALFVGGGYVLGTLLASRLAKTVTAPLIVYSGLGLALASSFLLVLVSAANPTVWQLLVCMALFTVGMGIVIPSAAACALSRFPEIAGSAAGLLGALQIFIGALGTSVIGLFHSASPMPIAVVMVCCAALALCSGYVALFPFRERKISLDVRKEI